MSENVAFERFKRRPGPNEKVQEPTVETRAQGKDDGSLYQTPSNYYSHLPSVFLTYFLIYLTI